MCFLIQDFRNGRFDLCLQKTLKFGISITSAFSIVVSLRQIMSYLLITPTNSVFRSLDDRLQALMEIILTLEVSEHVSELQLVVSF